MSMESFSTKTKGNASERQNKDWLLSEKCF